MGVSKIKKIDLRSIFDGNLPKRTKIRGGKVERGKNQGTKLTNYGQQFKSLFNRSAHSAGPGKMAAMQVVEI